MAEISGDNVLEISTSIGTSDMVLSGAPLGYRAFSQVPNISIGSTFYGSVKAVDGNDRPSGDWEVGYYTYKGTSIERTTVLSSSNGNQRVNFGSGRKHVFVTLSAYQLNQFQRITTTTPPPTTTTPPPTTGGGTTTPDTSVKPFGRDASLYGALTFREDFDGSTWDTAKWSKGMFYSTPNKNNVAVQNGSLFMWAEQPYTNHSTDPSSYNEPNASLTTDGKFYQRYGYFECRARLPKGRALWPSFWLYNHDTGGIRPELDVFEAYSGGTPATGQDWADANYVPQRFQATVYGNVEGQPAIGSRNSQQTFGYADLTQWHRYGMHWDAQKVQFTFNGEDVGLPIFTNDPNMRMYLLLTCWLGSASGFPSTDTSITPTGITNAFEVDYVYAWALADGSTTVEGTAPPPTGSPVDPSTSGVKPFGQTASNYTNVLFSDEFKGTSLDAAKWNRNIWYTTEPAIQNYNVSGGCLNIWPQADSTGAFRDRWFTTSNIFTRAYGYFEIEATLPIGTGPRLVFTLGNHEGDVFRSLEVLSAWPGGNPDWATSAKHPDNYNMGLWTADGVDNFSRKFSDYLVRTDLSAGPHKFAIEWTPTTVRYFFDGQAIGAAISIAYSRPSYLMLGFLYGGVSGTPNATNNSITPQGSTNAFKINYVRAWGHTATQPTTSLTHEAIPSATFSVATYGAVPGASSVTNRAGFNAAFEAVVAAGGGTLTIPPGTYDLGSYNGNDDPQPVGADNLRNCLISGYGATLQFTSNVNDTPTILAFLNPYNVGIAGLTFTDPGTNNQLASGWRGAVCIDLIATASCGKIRTTDCTVTNATTFVRSFPGAGHDYKLTELDINGTLSNVYYGINLERTGRFSKCNLSCTAVRRGIHSYGLRDWEVKMNLTAATVGSNAFVSLACRSTSENISNVNIDLDVTGTAQHSSLIHFYHQFAPSDLASMSNITARCDITNYSASSGNKIFLFDHEGTGPVWYDPTNRIWSNINLDATVVGTFGGTLVDAADVSNPAASSVKVSLGMASMLNMSSLPSYFSVG